MIKAYINYPNPHMSIHKNPDCQMIQKNHAPNQRIFKIDIHSFANVLMDFVDEKFVFRTEKGFNDIWLEIDFKNSEFEIAIARYILNLLGNRYSPLRSINPEIHC